MTNRDVSTEFENRYTGFVLLWSDVVPQHPHLKFHRRCEYGVPRLEGETIPGVGDIWSVQKKEEGLWIVVKSTHPLDGPHEWTYTVNVEKIEVSGYALDPATGQAVQQLVKYPIVSIGVQKKENMYYASPTVKFID